MQAAAGHDDQKTVICALVHSELLNSLEITERLGSVFPSLAPGLWRETEGESMTSQDITCGTGSRFECKNALSCNGLTFQ
ncbi:hypothetical protein ANANG_G00241600 [Anguilla anguilla]|uniref:Uncharacterized protein n=1 Tax=Anguilla anguilla TaxID=7936 RepID=A0A9D3RS48_ANGAN|nr:hypothetical protein ANANG_G00241600 [Anguilla anguilla]